MNRLVSGQEGSNWRQTFGIDRWGNRWIDEANTSGIAVASGTPNGASWYVRPANGDPFPAPSYATPVIRLLFWLNRLDYLQRHNDAILAIRALNAGD